MMKSKDTFGMSLTLLMTVACVNVNESDKAVKVEITVLKCIVKQEMKS